MESMRVVEESSSEPITAYPNPAREFVSLTIQNINSAPAQSDIMIVDGTGRTYPVHATWFSESKRLDIDLTPMTEGIYIIKVRTPLGNQTLRILKKDN
jgi:hypothetical protein